VKTETKTLPDLGKVTLTRGNPVCKEKTGSQTCLYCVTMATGKETYVANDAEHMIKISGKNKTETLILREGAILPAESLAELRAVFTSTCKQYGCTDKDIGKWQSKIVRFSSIGEALK
jgi:hypothetical protein